MNIKQILNLKETHPIEKAVLMIDNKVFDSLLSEDEMQSLADHFVNISKRDAMELWSIMGAGTVENTIGLHQTKVNGRYVSEYIVELLTSEAAAQYFEEREQQYKVKWRDPENRIKYMNQKAEKLEMSPEQYAAKQNRIKELGACSDSAARRITMMNHKAEAVERFKQLFGSRVKED